MFRGQLRRAALAMLVAILAAAGMQLATGAPAAAVRTVYYDASRTGEFRTNFDQAAQIWNSRVSNVRLLAGTPASITIYVDDGWPRAQPTGLGSGRIWMGRTAVNQGYDRTRIATHEVGHILGLPDRRTGLCSDLMSGSSAPVSCRNANPSAAEASRVNSLFAGTLAAPASTTYTWNGASDIGPLVVGGRPATENYPFMVYVSGCTGTLIKAQLGGHRQALLDAVLGAGGQRQPYQRRHRGAGDPGGQPPERRRQAAATGQLGHVRAGPDPEHLRRGRHRHPDHRLGPDLPPRGCGSAPAVANELDTSIVADSRCSGINGAYEICTNNTNGNSGACYGDSGGPQVRQVSGRVEPDRRDQPGRQQQLHLRHRPVHLRRPAVDPLLDHHPGRWPARLTIRDIAGGGERQTRPRPGVPVCRYVGVTHAIPRCGTVPWHIRHIGGGVMPTVVVLALTLALAPAPSPSATSDPLGDIIGGVGQIVDDLLGGDTPSAAPRAERHPHPGVHAESATGRRSAQPGGAQRDPRARRARRAVSPHPPPPIAAPLTRAPAPARPPCPGATATPPHRPPPPALASPTRNAWPPVSYLLVVAVLAVLALLLLRRRAPVPAATQTPDPGPRTGLRPATGSRPGAGQRQPVADQPQRHLRDGPAG